MKCRLHYVEFRPTGESRAAQVRKGENTWHRYRTFEAVTIEEVGTAAQRLWDEILNEGEEVEFRRVEVYALDWQPTRR